MQFQTSSLVSFLALAGLVASHGMPSKMTIGGTSYPGANGPGGDTSKSPVRPINNGADDGAPIDDVNSPDMACGIQSNSAKVSAKASAGSNVDIWWQGPTGIPWFHAAGPIMTYMAACNGDCSSFNPSASTEWFKISELGLKTPGDPSSWYQADLPSGKPVSLTLPSNLKSGNYLLRQEIIATQNSQTKDKTEFYPACVQLEIDGSSDGPTPSPTVNFPGAYKDTDPGIFGNFYNPGLNYVFPGGALSNVASASSSTSGSTSPAGSGSSDPAPFPASSSAAPAASSPASAPINVGADPSAPAPPPASASSSAPAPKATKTCKKKRSVTANNSSFVRSKMSMHKKRRTTHF